jgi:hypothetical protein
MSSRFAYVQALRTERAMYSARPDAKARRLKEIDAELAKYENEPDDTAIETAVPGPIVSGRKRRVKRTPAEPVESEPSDVEDDGATAGDGDGADAQDEAPRTDEE